MQNLAVGRPWLAHYDEGVPSSLEPYPERTLLDYLADSAADDPARPALLFKGSRVSIGDLDRLSDAFAATLASLGVRKGDRVALLLPNAPQFVIAQIGAWKAGAVVVPLNPLYNEHELAQPIASAGAETIVVLTPFYQRVKRIQAETPLTRVIATNIKEFLPPLLKVLFTLFKEKRNGHRIRLERGDLWFHALLRRHVGRRRPDVPVAPDDLALILMSGGTTGTPKGVMGLHRHLVMAGLQQYAWGESLVGEGDVLMLPLPLFHVYGNAGVLSASIVGRSPLALVPNPRDLNDVLRTIRQVRPSCFYGVPTLFIALLNHPDVVAGKVDFRSIKLCVSGAAPLLAETRKRFEEVTGGRLIEGYSLTEAMMACLVNPVHGVNKPGSVGIPLPDVEVRVVETETGARDLAAGEVGEILMRAPQIMRGYWQNPAETAGTIRSHGDGDPWLHTGDLGYLDEDGYLFIVDRKKDLIKTSGYQVWPREIEEVIASHPAVAEVGVAGIPDPVKGEAVKAWIVPRAGAAIAEQEIRAFCKERLAPYKVPVAVEFRRDLPKTMVGKVLRRALVQETKAG